MLCARGWNRSKPDSGSQSASGRPDRNTIITTTFDATLALTPSSLAGTTLLARPHDAVGAVRGAGETTSGAAWIDIEWQNIRGEWPLVDRMVVRADEGGGHAEALNGVVEMVARRALEVCAAR